MCFVKLLHVYQYIFILCIEHYSFTSRMTRRNNKFVQFTKMYFDLKWLCSRTARKYTDFYCSTHLCSCDSQCHRCVFVLHRYVSFQKRSQRLPTKVQTLQTRHLTSVWLLVSCWPWCWLSMSSSSFGYGDVSGHCHVLVTCVVDTF